MKTNESKPNKFLNFEAEHKLFKMGMEQLGKLGQNSLTFSKFKKRKLPKEQEISKFFYTSAYFLLRLICTLLFKFSVKRAPELKELKGSNIIIAPHASYLDAVFVMLAWGHKVPLYFLASTFLKESQGFLKWITVKMCTINITQFNSDFMAVKRMLNLLRNGKSIAIFPEGERSGDGRHELFSDAFIKLLQRAHANIVFCDLPGAFLSWPRWSGNGGLRPGKVQAEVKVIWTKDEVANLDLNAIRDTIAELFNVSDYSWQLEAAEKGKKTHKYLSFNRAKGLCNLLHSCPSCSETCCMFQKDHKTIACSYCDFTAELGLDGLFKHTIEFPAIGKNKVVTSRNPIVWHLWQIRHNTVRFLKHTAPDYLLPSSGMLKIEEFKGDDEIKCHAEKALAYFALDWAHEEPRFTLAFVHNADELADLNTEVLPPHALSYFAVDDNIIDASSCRPAAAPQQGADEEADVCSSVAATENTSAAEDVDATEDASAAEKLAAHEEPDTHADSADPVVKICPDTAAEAATHGTAVAVDKTAFDKAATDSSAASSTPEAEAQTIAESVCNATEPQHRFTHILKVPAQHFVYEDINSYFQFWFKNYRLTYTPSETQMIYLYRDLIEGLGQSDLDPRLAKCHVDNAKDLIANFRISADKMKNKEKE